MDSNLHITGQFEIEETGVTLNDLAPIPAQTVTNSSDILDLNQRINNLLYPIGSVVTLSSRYETLSNGVYEEGKNYYTKNDTTKQYTLLVAGTDYTIGNTISTTVYKEITPAEIYGGKWELVDKEFKPQWINDTNLFVANSTWATESSTPVAIFSGHSLRIRLALKTAQALTDYSTPKTLGTLQLSNLGVERFIYTQTLHATTNTNDHIGRIRIVHDTGVVDYWGTIGENTTLDSGKILNIDTTFTLVPTHQTEFHAIMLDDFCDKFYWKRTE